MGRVRMHSESSVCMVFLIVMLTVCFFLLFRFVHTGIQTLSICTLIFQRIDTIHFVPFKRKKHNIKNATRWGG